MSQPVIVYVRLLDEGTDVARPTPAVAMGGDLYELDATPIPIDEHWEFPPGSIVRCEMCQRDGRPYLLAVSLSLR